jgi:hypothetical protein
MIDAAILIFSILLDLLAMLWRLITFLGRGVREVWGWLRGKGWPTPSN